MAFRTILISLLFIWSCSKPNAWTLNTIETGSKVFDASRLTYASAQVHSPLAFELIKMGDQIEAFFNLTRFHFTNQGQVQVSFTIEGETFEESVPVMEGAMRVRLMPEMTQRLIQALQEGHKIAILIDGFEETLEPLQFASSFAKFLGE